MLKTYLYHTDFINSPYIEVELTEDIVKMKNGFYKIYPIYYGEERDVKCEKLNLDNLNKLYGGIYNDDVLGYGISSAFYFSKDLTTLQSFAMNLERLKNHFWKMHFNHVCKDNLQFLRPLNNLPKKHNFLDGTQLFELAYIEFFKLKSNTFSKKHKLPKEYSLVTHHEFYDFEIS